MLSDWRSKHGAPEMTKSPQSQGGTTRAEKLTTEQRREIAKTAAAARWNRIEDPQRVPEADSQGVLFIGDVGLEVYVLDDKRRVISKKAMANALRLQSEGGNAFLRTMSRKGVRSVLSENLISKIENPIFFKPLGGDLADGFEAETLIEVCDALIEAKNQKRLHSSQSFLALQAESSSARRQKSASSPWWTRPRDTLTAPRTSTENFSTSLLKRNLRSGRRSSPTSFLT